MGAVDSIRFLTPNFWAFRGVLEWGIMGLSFAAGGGGTGVGVFRRGDDAGNPVALSV